MTVGTGKGEIGRSEDCNGVSDKAAWFRSLADAVYYGIFIMRVCRRPL